METNREEALRSIAVAKRAILEGNILKAKKFLEKSMRICPTAEAEELLAKLANKFNTGDSTPAESNGTTRQRRNSSPHRKASDENLEIVKKITTAKSYYDIFDLNRSEFAENDLKKKYRKLALQVHPDKNMASGAAEAFKKVGIAYSTLSDRTKRAEYDYCLENPQAERRKTATSARYEYTDAHPDVEDLFNHFFSSGFSTGTRRTYFYQRPQRQARHAEDNNTRETTSLYSQVLPMVFFLTISVISSFMQAPPAHSLTRSDVYVEQRLTRSFGMEYFVTKDFHKTHSDNQIRQIEDWVDGERVHSLQYKCYQEQRVESRNRRSGKQKQNAEQAIPSCMRLRQLNVPFYTIQV